MKRAIKISLWVVGIVVVLSAVGALAIFTFANKAVDNFRDSAGQQQRSAAAGKDAGVTVKLQEIWLADFLNPSYKKIDNLQPTYQKLLVDIKNVVAITNLNNSLVSKYENGIKGNTPLNSDVLKTVNSYLAAMKNRFPDEKDRIAALSKLSDKIAASTGFDDISADMYELLQSNLDWLNGLSKSINARIDEFGKRINAI